MLPTVTHRLKGGVGLGEVLVHGGEVGQTQVSQPRLLPVWGSDNYRGSGDFLL